MANNHNPIKNLKDLEMQGMEPAEQVARHKAYMNTLNATVKSLQQSMNYLAALDLRDKYSAVREEWRTCTALLEQAQADHFALLAKLRKQKNAK